MLPVFCSFADWYLADSLGLASFLDGSWRIVDDVKHLLLPYADEISRGTELGMEVGGKCLLLCGLTMTYARDSVPVSGYEHVISHMLDMAAAKDGRQTGIHGHQVGIASVLSLLNIEYLIEKLDWITSGSGFDIEACFPGESAMKKKVMGLFHEIDPSDRMGAECWRDYSAKLSGWHGAKARLKEFLKNWGAHKPTLAGLLTRSAAECLEGLMMLGLPLEFQELTPPVSEERGRWAFRNAMFMRKRLTAADIAFYLGLADDAWENAIFGRYRDLARCVKEKATKTR
jgi:glycerol-1-phosphate dehydrogenase [NAD(P)+]